MNSIELVCPHCSARLTVSRNAPQQLICPTCLARIHNPLGLPPGGTFRSLEPLAADVEADRKSISFGSMLLVAMLGAGCISALWPGHNGGSEIGVLVFAVMTLLILTILAVFKNQAIARPDSPEHPLLRIVRVISKLAAMAVLVIFGIWLLIFGLCAVVFIGANVGAKFTR
jgi:hypothetical protein